jgi:hypothetical protein
VRIGGGSKGALARNVWGVTGEISIIDIDLWGVLESSDKEQRTILCFPWNDPKLMHPEIEFCV